jgi:hypothetical protein
MSYLTPLTPPYKIGAKVSFGSKKSGGKKKTLKNKGKINIRDQSGEETKLSQVKMKFFYSQI